MKPIKSNRKWLKKGRVLAWVLSNKKWVNYGKKKSSRLMRSTFTEVQWTRLFFDRCWKSTWPWSDSFYDWLRWCEIERIAGRFYFESRRRSALESFGNRRHGSGPKKTTVDDGAFPRGGRSDSEEINGKSFDPTTERVRRRCVDFFSTPNKRNAPLMLQLEPVYFILLVKTFTR